MNKSLDGKIALVTGSSRGIGRATTLRFAREGARVIINYRDNRQAADSLAAEIAAFDGSALVVQGDVSSVAGVRALLERVDRALEQQKLPPKIDILVANAGINHGAVIEQMSEEDFDRLFDLNVKGVFFLIQETIKRMGDGGRIVTVSSGLARFCLPPYIAYACTKGAIEVMTRYLAQYLGPRGITVNCIAPGAIATDMNKAMVDDPKGRAMLSGMSALGRLGQPEDIADAMLAVVGDTGRWISGQRIEVSGGAVLGPKLG